MRAPGSSARPDRESPSRSGMAPPPGRSGSGACPVASATKAAKPGAASTSRARTTAPRRSSETSRANHSQKRTEAATVPPGTQSARRHSSGPAGAGSWPGTVTTSTRSARDRRAASKPRRESSSHRSGSTAIQTRRPGAPRAASSRRRRLASAAPRGVGTRLSAEAGATAEPSTSKIRGSDPPSRARAFSHRVRARTERSARSESPRHRCRAPEAAGSPSSGNARKAPATQNSARRADASRAWSCASSARTAGVVMRPPRSKSRCSRAASAGAGPPGSAGPPTVVGVRASHSRAVPAQRSQRASSKSLASRTNPRDAKNAAAAAACRKTCIASERGTRPSAMRRPAATSRHTSSSSPSRPKSRAGASVACSSSTKASQRSRLAAIRNRSGTPVASSVAMEPPGLCLCIVARRDREQATEKGCGTALRAPWGQMQGSATTAMREHRRGAMRCLEWALDAPDGSQERFTAHLAAPGLSGSGSRDSRPPFAERTPRPKAPDTTPASIFQQPASAARGPRGPGRTRDTTSPRRRGPR